MTDTSPLEMKPLPTDRYVKAAAAVLFMGGLTFALLYGAGDGHYLSTEYLTSASILWATAAIAYGINWLVFIPANAYQTEKFYDLTGAVTYTSCTISSLLMGASPKFEGADWSFSNRAIIQSIFVIVWCIRLGSFLFKRIRKDKKDGRFDEIKINPPRFFVVWTIQGLWVLLTALPVFTVNASNSPKTLEARDFIGWGIWAIGFAIEVIADRQKSAFAANPDNKGKYINEGLWYYSRHPNYFGEMTLWFGQFIAASSIFTDAQWTCTISPLFVIFLLTKVSGVPLLEKRSDEKFGTDPGYLLYKQNTSVVVIWFKGTSTQVEASNSQLLGDQSTTTQYT